MKFNSVPTTAQKSPWCVDGRPDYSASKGPQMLGGSLHPVVLSALFSNKKLTKDLYTAQLGYLKKAGFTLGVHWGAHQDPASNRSDCGFSDRMKDVIDTAKKQQDEIVRRLLEINTVHKHSFGSTENVRFLLHKAYTHFDKYGLDSIQIYGDELISLAKRSGAASIQLAGDHGETAAFVNLHVGSTLDTNGLNKQNKQAFNLDLWAVKLQAKELGVEEGFAIAASLILYMATEMVLVEQKGKDALPVFINS